MAPRLPLLCSLALLIFSTPMSRAAEPRWWKGNLHTHSLWSDGDDYPDMIADWYKERGYHFLAISDHNLLPDAERWSPIAARRTGDAAFAKYLARFGAPWVESREGAKGREVRLRRLDEYAPRFDEAGRFLLIPAEEITARVHVNAINLRELILPYTGADQKTSEGVVATLQRVLNTLWDQRQRTGVPMFAHVNHPNFQWAVTAEELAQLDHSRFFEVYNGHPTVHNEGDAAHASTDKIWDVVLTLRLGVLHRDVVYGIGNDDSHQYHEEDPTKGAQPGRGWVVVRAAELSASALVEAMERGDFYASSGVTLSELQTGADGISLTIAAEPGVQYTTEFIGTRKGAPLDGEPVLDEKGQTLRATRRYSEQVGAILATTHGPTARYTFKGDELYVRARVLSSKPKLHSAIPHEVERAWIQPVRGPK